MVEEMNEMPPAKEQHAGSQDSALKLAGRWIEGNIASSREAILKQNWGFITSRAYTGTVFFHLSESPELKDSDFRKGDSVEFYVFLDDTQRSVRGQQLKVGGHGGSSSSAC